MKSVRFLLILCILNLFACAALPKKGSESDAVSISADSVTVEPDESLVEDELDPNLPNVELDQATLEQLLVQNFASYNGDWGQASENALLAAKSAGDYRIARTATLLALRGNDYQTAKRGAELWVQLQPDSTEAVNILIIAQVGSDHVDEALVTIAEQGQDLELSLIHI